jgi:hypothetical protein
VVLLGACDEGKDSECENEALDGSCLTDTEVGDGGSQAMMMAPGEAAMTSAKLNRRGRHGASEVPALKKDVKAYISDYRSNSAQTALRNGLASGPSLQDAVENWGGNVPVDEDPPWWEESGVSNNIYYSTGNVSIGEAVSAASKLQVLGTESYDLQTDTTMPVGTLRLKSSNSQYLFMDGNEIDTYSSTSPYAGTTLYFQDNSRSNVAFGRYGGSVAVGMDPGASKLEVKGIDCSDPTSGDPVGTMRIKSTASNYMLLDGNEIDSYTSTHAANSIYLNYNSGGKVVIGNVTPADITTKLTVDGGIKAEEIVVEDVTSADFVFADDYQLMPLEEVSRFVEENRHLPEIAPAEEMETEGLNIGAFQVQLLQKIEELTLYAIEQKRRVDYQEKRIEELSKKCDGQTAEQGR